jgi:hypothetical protein
VQCCISSLSRPKYRVGGRKAIILQASIGELCSLSVVIVLPYNDLYLIIRLNLLGYKSMKIYYRSVSSLRVRKVSLHIFLQTHVFDPPCCYSVDCLKRVILLLIARNSYWIKSCFKLVHVIFQFRAEIVVKILIFRELIVSTECFKRKIYSVATSESCQLQKGIISRENKYKVCF